MATYYVDYALGIDTNDGLTTSTPWKYCPGDSRAEVGHVLVTGDTVYFKRGVTYSIKAAAAEGIFTKVAGITYSITSWGTEDAVIDIGSTVYSDICGFSVNHSNTTIDGGSGKNLKITGTGCDRAGIWCYGTSMDLTGCSFVNLKLDAVGSSGSSEGMGIKIGGNSQAYTNMLVDSCLITNCYEAGIKISGNGTWGAIGNCELAGNGAKAGEKCQINISSALSNGIQIDLHDCIIHDSGSTSVNGVNVNGCGSKIRGCLIYANTGAGITVQPDYSSHAGTIDIYRNFIYANTGIWDEGLRVGGGDVNRYARIWDNIFANNGGAGNCYQIRTLDGSAYTKIWNNTIYTSNGNGGIWHYGTSASSDIRDNVVSVNGFYCIRVDNTSEIEDYNLLDNSRGGGEITGRTAGTHDSLGLDAKFVDPMNSNFMITGLSPAVDSGIADPGSGTFFDDYLGKSRLGKLAWDSGAYGFFRVVMVLK